MNTDRAIFRLTGGVRITWICNDCGKPIVAGSGYVTVDDRRADRNASESEAFWRRRWAEAGDDRFLVTRASDIPFHPPVPWQAFHGRCDPNPDDGGYWFDVHRADTIRKVMHWAGHLMCKTWIDGTDLPDLLMRMGQDA